MTEPADEMHLSWSVWVPTGRLGGDVQVYVLPRDTRSFARNNQYFVFDEMCKRLLIVSDRIWDRDSSSYVTIPMIYNFMGSDRRNLDVKSLDPTKMTMGTYILFVESLRLHRLFSRAMTHCFIALKVFLGLMVESSDSKAKIQEIKAKIQDKFNYNGSCMVKIGIIPEGSGTPFLKVGVLRRTATFRRVHSTQLVLRLIGAKHISREYDITSNVSKLSTSEVIVLPRF